MQRHGQPERGQVIHSIQTERGIPAPVPQATSVVGIDMGVVRFATLSNGASLAPLGFFKKHEARLRRYQRAINRKPSSATTRRRPRPASGAFTPGSVMPAATCGTRRRPRPAMRPAMSAKTTRWCVSRTCRCGTRPGRRQARSMRQARTFGPQCALASFPSALAGWSRGRCAQ